MKGSIIHNTGSAVTVRLPSGEAVPARSVIEALDMVARAKCLQQEGFGQINTIDCRTAEEKARSRDEFLCGECWIELGGIDCRCSDTDRSGQDSLPDQVEGTRPQGAGEAASSAAASVGCAGDCATCRCGCADGEGR